MIAREGDIASDEGPRPEPLTGTADAAKAVKNAGVLGLSMMLTWTLALGARLLMPRFLGPEVFGELYVAEAMATAFFVLTTLGVDTYIRKEVATRPELASEFFGALTALRLLLGVLLTFAMAAFLEVTDRPESLRTFAFLFAASQLFLTINNSSQALLHAVGHVRGLAVTNVAAKLIWALAIILLLTRAAPAWCIPAAYFLAEAVRAPALIFLARRHAHLVVRLEPRALAGVLGQSLPFYFCLLTQTLYDKSSATMIGIMAGAEEAGWYGAARTLVAVSLLMMPLLSAVVLPLSSRAAERSSEELDQVMLRILRIVLSIVTPICLVLSIWPEQLTTLLYGPSYAPAALSLRVLSLTLILTNVATLSSIYLVQLGRAWAVAGVSALTLAGNIGANAIFIPLGARLAGDGGASLGSACASVLMEVLAIVMLFLALRSPAFTRSSARLLSRSAALCAGVAIVDLCAWTLGPMRFVIDAAACGALALRLGLPRREDLAYVVPKQAVRRIKCKISSYFRS